MLGINYFRAEPTEFARLTVGGKMKKEGTGIACFYMPYRTSIELIGVTTVDQPFVFTETTSDNQELSLQGGFLYRVVDPGKALSKYNFAIDPKGRQFLSEDPTKLPEHILQVARASARRIVQGKQLEELLTISDEMSKEVSEELTASPSVINLGVEVEMLYFASIVPPPDIARALGAEYREGLLQQADKASYERRAMAVEQERAIQENELRNKIQLEGEREKLVQLEGENRITEARFKADAAKLEMAVFEEMSPNLLRAHALYELGKNAQKIQNLTITPELLAGLRDAI
jgi:regulator of protease activity HflC (stomatin/prohibitin superfamily)